MSETRANLLIELGTEELPPKELPRLAQAFRAGLFSDLKSARLDPQSGHCYFGPRRLTVYISDLLIQQPDQQIDRLGPAVAAAFKDGQPTPAASGFAKSCGVTVEELEHRETDKGVRLAFTKHETGVAASNLILSLAADALSKLPVSKSMRWNDHAFEFSRPVQWLVALLGDQVVDGELYGQPAGRHSRGHRFHSQGDIAIADADSYVETLRAAHVLVDADERKRTIVAGAEKLAEGAGGKAQIRGGLLEEAANLVEWPVPFVGQFDESFLEVPPEALISSMESHQKCFSIVDANGALLPKFVGVANIESRDPAQMIEGFERVIRPRLADAQFFWNNDLKKPLTDHQPALQRMVFQEKLGTLWDKVLRVKTLAMGIARELGLDQDAAGRAAELAKCDLLSEMVYEFPELQGIAGHRIAARQGEGAEIAQAIEEQYLPKGAGDSLPRSKIGQVLALADRLDTLAGIFAAGLKPTGSKDPFALRRAGLGVVRIVVERELDLDISTWLSNALAGVAARIPNAEKEHAELLTLVMDRLRAYYADQQITTDVFDAVWERRPTRLLDFHHRLQACRGFRALPEAPALAAANKRIGNILKKSDTAPADRIDENLFEQDAERALAEVLADARAAVRPLVEAGSYEPALQALAGLRPTADAFFDHVMVMAEHPAVRANRLALLARVKALFDSIADVSKLELTD